MLNPPWVLNPSSDSCPDWASSQQRLARAGEQRTGGHDTVEVVLEPGTPSIAGNIMTQLCEGQLQAWIEALERGQQFVLEALDGEPYSEALFRSKVSGSQRYRVTVRMPGVIVPSSACTECGFAHAASDLFCENCGCRCAIKPAGPSAGHVAAQSPIVAHQAQQAQPCDGLNRYSTVFLQPGPLGIYVDNATSGLVTELYEGQMKATGLVPPFVLESIDGQPYSEVLLDQKRSGDKPYQLRVRTPAPGRGLLPTDTAEVLLEPGPLGIYVSDVSTGLVTQVYEGQLRTRGLMPPFTLLAIDGEPYSEARLEEKSSGNRPYRVTLELGGAAEANPEDVEQMLSSCKEVAKPSSVEWSSVWKSHLQLKAKVLYVPELVPCSRTEDGRLFKVEQHENSLDQGRRQCPVSSVSTQTQAESTESPGCFHSRSKEAELDSAEPVPAIERDIFDDQMEEESSPWSLVHMEQEADDRQRRLFKVEQREYSFAKGRRQCPVSSVSTQTQAESTESPGCFHSRSKEAELDSAEPVPAIERDIFDDQMEEESSPRMRLHMEQEADDRQRRVHTSSACDQHTADGRPLLSTAPLLTSPKGPQDIEEKEYILYGLAWTRLVLKLTRKAACDAEEGSSSPVQQLELTQCEESHKEEERLQPLLVPSGPQPHVAVVWRPKWLDFCFTGIDKLFTGQRQLEKDAELETQRAEISSMRVELGRLQAQMERAQKQQREEHLLHCSPREPCVKEKFAVQAEENSYPWIWARMLQALTDRASNEVSSSVLATPSASRPGIYDMMWARMALKMLAAGSDAASEESYAAQPTCTDEECAEPASSEDDDRCMTAHLTSQSTRLLPMLLGNLRPGGERGKVCRTARQAKGLD
eukprot:TRINITY_DN1508_c0_g1_i1.p1 TRINITY_DN1508_c0_g1~~TRINITY_DN1508_c0_g1_i1.p1  ORF type:complete len:868 (+),score=153.38 TRINITY_DN1508_c0_g1_i1:57-2660(+)